MEGLEDRLAATAVAMVEKRGWADVTVRQVADASRVSYGAPVARFGDELGLLAAVAERGFRQLERELAPDPTNGDSPRPSATLRASAVKSLGLRYVEFALTRRHLHRAMHHPDLWARSPARKPASPSIARRDAKSAGWRARAAAARDACFARFVTAVIAGQVEGTVADGSPGMIARVVTALADGYILQTSDESVDSDAGLERQLAVADRLFDWAEKGLGPGAL
jgi:AcrR family transcriptional regulator